MSDDIATIRCGSPGPGVTTCGLTAGHGARCPHEAKLDNGVVLRWDGILPATITIDSVTAPRLFEAAMGAWPTPALAPIPLLLTCPMCCARHIDALAVDGTDWATKPHHTHACQKCGHVWRPAIVNTVGVQFLPGFKNEVTSAADEGG